MASKKARTSSLAGAGAPAPTLAGDSAGGPSETANGAGGIAPSEGFNIVDARRAIPVLGRVLRAWDKALGAQHTPTGFAVEFVAHIEPSRLDRILCASDAEIGRLAEQLASAYPSVRAADWRPAFEAKRVKPRTRAAHASTGRPPKRKPPSQAVTTAGAESAADNSSGNSNGPAGACAPSCGFTPDERAQYRIPEWADGSDMRPGESLEKYGRRKRMEGEPRDRRIFIGET